LHSRDLALLVKIQKFFGCGALYKVKNKNSLCYLVNSLDDLNKPYFEKFSLLSQKAADFILFKRIVELMNNKSHLTEEGLQKIINIRASMNFGLSNNQINHFPKTIPVQRPIINTINIPDPN
jgi:hypothetical protein